MSKTNFYWNHWKEKNKLPQINVDIKEAIARTAQEATANDFYFELKQENKEWEEFIDNIKQNNELLKLIKSDVRLKSLYGKNYLAFEFYDNKILIFNADIDNTRNKTIRINQQKEVVGSIYRKVAVLNDMEYLSIIERHTEHTIKREYPTSVGVNQFLLDEYMLNSPKYFKDLYTEKTKEHNYGVLCIKEMLNRSLIDFESQTNDKLTDWYSARDLIKEFNELMEFSRKERNLNHTRIVGSIIDTQRQQNNSKNIFAFNEDIINSDLILSTLGAEKNSFEIMQSTYDMQQHIQAANELLDLIFKLSGYVWNQGDKTNYQNTETSSNLNRATFETTKMKVELYTNDWIEFLKRIAIAYFKVRKYGDRRLSSIEQAEHNKKISFEFDNLINFKIISNLIKDYNDNTQRVIELYGSDLMPLEVAINKLYTEYTAEEQTEIIAKLESQKQMITEEFDEGEE